jgi:hypothetical protein
MPKPSVAENLGPIPEANQPGHHPEVEQDKPRGMPSGPPAIGDFDFAFHPLFRLPARLVGVTPATATVHVGEREVEVRFGPWRMAVDRDDIVEVTRTGPYRPWRVLGPPHLSFADRGITFATTPQRGVCLRLRHPVPGIEPTGWLRHPAITVTVADVEGLVDLLE